MHSHASAGVADRDGGAALEIARLEGFVGHHPHTVCRACGRKHRREHDQQGRN